ncbi:MAG: acetylxylan esterase [Verrucomicrobiaceae bacterium]|nr:acetylxylan esterase [Verrucomicrobiaceae bacterium]
MKHPTSLLLLLLPLGWLGAPPLGAQDLSLYGSVSREGRAISGASLARAMSPEEWEGTLAERREKWREMLGLSPLPERTPLQATVTGVLDRGDYVVEKIHFQSSPGAHVAGNLYRPAKITGKLPAVLYLCGHSKGKVNAPYQANPRWFGQHGYVALVLDPIQLGECQGMHHGTYREGRFDWPSRGYTPAGTEVWNAMRALDYLESRDDVDGEKMGVTGLSGGGAMSWFLGAADERVKAVAPVCQSGSIERMAVDRATDGHCDCAFWINYYRWCWPDIGALIAPRAFLIASGSEDVLWRPAGYRDVAHRIRHQYAALGVPDQFDLVEDLSPHGYTPKLRQAIFTFFNTHLKNDPTPVRDDVTDFVEPEENLLVFGGTLPSGDTMMRMDERLVQAADIALPDDESQWRTHQQAALARLRETTFRNLPASPAPRLRDILADGGTRDGTTYGTRVFDTADGLTLAVKTRQQQPHTGTGTAPTILFAMQPEARSTFTGGGASRPPFAPEFPTAGVEVRHTGATSVGPGYLWTLRRVYPLLGHTLPERQVSDLLAGTALIRRETDGGPIAVYGKGDTAALAIYAALLDPEIGEIILENPPESHTRPETAEFLGILRTGDLPQNLALLHPRPITFIGKIPPAYEWTKRVYEALGQGDRIRVVGSAREWRPRE